jgi:hypothetical protein
MIKKRMIKAIMIIIMIVGIALSISNFFSLELRATRVVWEQLWEWGDGTYDCMGDGNSCCTVIEKGQ